MDVNAILIRDQGHELTSRQVRDAVRDLGCVCHQGTVQRFVEQVYPDLRQVRLSGRSGALDTRASGSTAFGWPHLRT